MNKLLKKADSKLLKYVSFREPDIGYQITASAFVPNPEVKPLLKGCQLLGGPSKPSEKRDALLDWVHLMRKEKQTEGLTLWQHGKDVSQKFKELRNGQYKNWPRIDSVKWIEEALKEPLPYSDEDIETYCLFHDIGKVNTSDGNGSFPGHAEESFKIWNRLDNREHISRWMKNDMAIHSMKKEDFLKIEDRKIHRLVGLSELYANAPYFGGFDSESFKIKFKKIVRNGSF